MVGRRKLAGILAEGIAIGTPRAGGVVGVGVNLQPAAYPPEVAARATSIEGELGRAVDRGPLLDEVLVALWRPPRGARSEVPVIFCRRGARLAPASGTRVEWDGRAGTTAGIDEPARCWCDRRRR